MNFVKEYSILFMTILIITGCNGQQGQEPINQNGEKIGGPFENREFMFIDMPESISSVDTSAGWNQDGQKLLITGTMYELDGKTPAPGVILYYYHTDIHGYYANKEGLNPKVKRHGYIRGWVKSDSNGKYSIYTVRPAPYPTRTMPAHIHPAIKEPDLDDPYYIDEFVFDDDTLLTPQNRKSSENRGGSGILKVVNQGKLQIAHHDIILGLNVPFYPANRKKTLTSGNKIGEDIHSFRPFHAWGPDKGTRTCPICKYGKNYGLLYFVGNNPAPEDIRQWVGFLEDQGSRLGVYFHAFLIDGNEMNYSEKSRRNELEKLGEEMKLSFVGLTFVPKLTDHESEIYLNNLNPATSNTILLFHKYEIVDKFINLPPNETSYRILNARIDEMMTSTAR